VSSAAVRLDELLARLPGTVRRGHAPAVRGDAADCLASGIPELDRALGGGFPRGRLSELRGRGSAGLTSLAHRLAARATARGELVGWIDAPDAFDPESASAAGIALERLLWVRPPDLATAFAAAEQILALGGFALVVLDADLPYRPRRRDAGVRLERFDDVGARRSPGRRPGSARRTGAGAALPSSTMWLRLARATARSRTALVALRHGVEPGAGASASLRLELPPARVVWDRAHGAPALLDGLVARVTVERNRGGAAERDVAVVLV
jgi:hypothetical protein